MVTKVKGSVDGSVLDNIEALLSASQSGQYTTLGYHTAGDGGGGEFYWDASQDKANHNGVTIIDPDITFPSDWTNATQIALWFTAGTGTGCWVRQYSGAADIRWAGAKFDGTTNDSPMWQQAVDTLSVITAPPGTTLLQTQVRISKPVIINGAGDGADLSSANRTTGVTLVSCTAVAGAFFLKSETLGNFLYGVQIKNMAIDGNNTGLIGIAGATISQCEFDNLHISRFTTDHLLIDDTNQNISVYNHIGRVVTNNGANAACADANGVRLRSTGYDGVVQTVIENLSTTITNGSGLKIGGADNNIILKHFNFRQATGTGYALYFYADTFLASRNNTVVFLGGGQVRAANNSYGNRIMHTTSESTEVTIDNGGQLHYVTHDYVSADLHSTHVFKMSDRLYMSANELREDGVVALKGLHASMWAAVLFPNSVTGSAYFNLPQNYDWHDGEVTGIELVFSTDTANTSANARMRVRGSSLATGEATATPSLDQSFTVSVNDTANRINKATLTFSTALTYTKNDTVLFRLDRPGGDALDTMIGDFELLGLNIIYQSTGPNFSGGGPYDVGPVDV